MHNEQRGARVEIHTDHREGYFAVEDVIAKNREQYEKVNDKETPFRCVFKSRYGWSYTYHETYEDALSAENSSCGYDVMGNAWTSRNKKLRIEKKGPRGGWSKYNPKKAAQVAK